MRNWILLGGGLERGTNALLIGAAGVGKSSLALTYAIAAAARNERSAANILNFRSCLRQGSLEGIELVDVARLAKPYTQAQLSMEIARLLPH